MSEYHWHAEIWPARFGWWVRAATDDAWPELIGLEDPNVKWAPTRALAQHRAAKLAAWHNNAGKREGVQVIEALSLERESDGR